VTENFIPESPKGQHKALAQAIELTKVDRVDRLLKHGVDPNGTDRYGRTHLMNAMTEHPHEDQVRVINALINAGADPNAEDDKGWTAMGPLIFYQPVWELINLLLDRGYDLRRFPRDASMLLSEALLYGEPAMIRRLVDMGIDPDQVQHQAATSLEEQISWGGGTAENVAILLEVGANPNRLDKAGQSPLVAAVRKRRDDILRVLLKNGADLDIPDKTDRTPLQIAERYGYWDSVELLGGRRPSAPLAQLRRTIGFITKIFD